MNTVEMVNEINRLRKEKNAVILAHNYQIPEVQDIADFVGDSLALSRKAAETDADIIVFCGVHFMAESAKILSPDKKVLLPVLDAGCPMADMIDAKQLKLFKEEYPNIPIVCYVNTSAEVKAESDICCTSSNAVKVVKSLDSNKILFIPDQNLGSYIAKQVPEKEIILWEGFCITHHRVSSQEVDIVREHRGNIKILVHPECNSEVVKKADFVGSTSQIIEYVNKSDDKKFVIGTEMGILHSLRKQNPEKKFHLLSPSLVCFNMKKTSLEDVYRALRDEINEINIEESVIKAARKSLERMLKIS
ncbi:quinolinate synthetase [Caminicella sporogenes DSM 14501]|uniref:Quinolinate synthase n=1 Tax=Caminicella sporogenes DSM 14501 TaxID=1121266 RepID=A0A1M6S8E6_9FIRM|nr:quinolinate synthase NadA [Caminicella sporogenes]RKD26914.1 quinolinate synthase [Caminicella sporogenes]SHK41084.1 quinolinate synthetase [Caminicella sporogenes DSM 14501]